MKQTRLTVTAFGLILAAAGLPVMADEAPPNPQANGASKFYPLVGEWKGDAQIAESGKQPAQVVMAMTCRKVSGGFAVSCEDTARNPDMEMAETDLFGFNPVDGSYHWYAVNSSGETHDHTVEFTGDTGFKAKVAWRENDAAMVENITMSFRNADSLSFRSVVTADGKEVAIFSGNLKK